MTQTNHMFTAALLCSLAAISISAYTLATRPQTDDLVSASDFKSSTANLTEQLNDLKAEQQAVVAAGQDFADSLAQGLAEDFATKNAALEERMSVQAAEFTAKLSNELEAVVAETNLALSKAEEAIAEALKSEVMQGDQKVARDLRSLMVAIKTELNDVIGSSHGALVTNQGRINQQFEQQFAALSDSTARQQDVAAQAMTDLSRRLETTALMAEQQAQSLQDGLTNLASRLEQVQADLAANAAQDQQTADGLGQLIGTLETSLADLGASQAANDQAMAQRLDRLAEALAANSAQDQQAADSMAGLIASLDGSVADLTTVQTAQASALSDTSSELSAQLEELKLTAQKLERTATLTTSHIRDLRATQIENGVVMRGLQVQLDAASQ